jgi:hypothetical protein
MFNSIFSNQKLAETLSAGDVFISAFDLLPFAEAVAEFQKHQLSDYLETVEEIAEELIQDGIAKDWFEESDDGLYEFTGHFDITYANGELFSVTSENFDEQLSKLGSDLQMLNQLAFTFEATDIHMSSMALLKIGRSEANGDEFFKSYNVPGKLASAPVMVNTQTKEKYASLTALEADQHNFNYCSEHLPQLLHWCADRTPYGTFTSVNFTERVSKFLLKLIVNYRNAPFGYLNIKVRTEPVLNVKELSDAGSDKGQLKQLKRFLKWGLASQL